MISVWKFFGIFFSLLSLSNFFVESSTCEFNAFVGQIFAISKSKVKQCSCTNSNNIYLLPKWLMYTGRGNHQLQGLPVNRDIGIYHVSLNPSSCFVVNVIQLNNTDPLQFKCNLRWPTLAAIILDVDLSKLSISERINLWNALKLNLKGAAGLRLLEDVTSFERSIFVLANGLGNSDGRIRSKGVAVVWQIGCGSVEFRHLKTLQWLEKSCLIGEFSQLIGGIPVEMWFVADLYDRDRISRMKREALWQRGKAGLGLQFNQRFSDVKYSSTLIEGSGMPRITGGSGDKPNTNKSNPAKRISRFYETTLPTVFGSTTPFMPVVRRNLSQVILTIHQINNFKIPRESFYDNQQGYSPALLVKAFYIFPKTKKEFEIFHNDSYWISYDKDLQNIRFLPKPAHIGSHEMILCAFDKQENKICQNLIIDVRPPTPITKSTVLQIAAGVLWTHEMPSQWLDGLTFNTTSDLTFAIEGDAIFCYDESKATLQVLTEAIESRILKIVFNITNPKEYQTLKYEFTLAVTDISPITHAMSNIFQVRLRWTGENLYPLNSIKSFLSEFSLALKSGKIANYVDPEDLLIYRVLHNRDFRITSRDMSPDDIFSLQIVYRPTKNATCEKAALKNAVPYIQTRQQLANFYIDTISEVSLKGICNHSQKPTTVSLKTSTISTYPSKPTPKIQSKPPDFNPSLLIQNFDVEAGLSFMRELNIKAAINEKLVRRFNFVDESEKNVTDENWIGLSPNGTFLYGLPLKEHVRKTIYKFWIVLYTVTAHVLKAPLTINVKPIVWMTNHQINHIIKLSLRFYDKSEENQKLTSLNFRVQLVKEIDRVLRPDFDGSSATEILLLDLKIYQKSLFLIEWSHLPVLETDGDLKEIGLQCPWNNLVNLYKKINGISNYPIEQMPIQQIPAQALSEGLQNAKIGSVVGVKIERMDPCKGNVPMNADLGVIKKDLLPNITAFCGQGFRVPIKTIQNDKSISSQPSYVQIFHENNLAVQKSYWLAASASNQFLYGLPMLFDAKIGQKYVLHIFPQNGIKIQSHFIVTVLPNPFQGAKLNHEIIMQLEFLSISPLTDSILQGLDLRWKVVSALDTYIRPKCSISTTAVVIPECAHRFDIILFDLKKVSNSQVLFEIRWSLRSLLQQTTFRKKREISPNSNNRLPECPEHKLLTLKGMLFGERDNRLEPLQKLKAHLKSLAGVNLKTVTLNKLGPCKGMSNNEPEIPQPTSQFKGQEDGQKMFLITTVIPVCAFTICILFVALMIALCMKRRNYSGYMKASQNSQLGPGSPVILPDEIDRSSYPPSKPLILPHEKPPLPPPDYNHESAVPNFVTMTTCSYRGPHHLVVNRLLLLEAPHIHMTDFHMVFLDSIPNKLSLSFININKSISTRRYVL